MKHITQEQRYTISVLLKRGLKKNDIARIIGKDKSTITREINRNCDKRNLEYKSDLAQRKCMERSREKRKMKRFSKAIQAYIDAKLFIKLSPEQIVGRARLEGIEMVSHERIYQYIWEDKKKGGQLFSHLRSRGKPYRKRGSLKDSRGIIPDRKHISQRPAIVDQKARIGDLEIDTVIGKNHKGALVTINDRKTGMVKISKVKGKNAQAVKMATLNLLSDWGFVKTITSDNGKEFALYKDIEKELKIDFYFATPYHSWERGANENTNGLIRQYIPKKTDFETISDEYVKFVENELNNRPRKRHGFKSPKELFFNELNLLEKNVAFVT